MIKYEELINYLNYDPLTGIFTWKIDIFSGNGKKQVCNGDIAGSVDKYGYLNIQINKKLYKSHRLAWLFINKEISKDLKIDHINHNKTDNKIDNLRLITQSENCKNRYLSTKNTSGCVGVSFCNLYKKWKVRISVDGNRKSLGYYAEKEEAILIRKQAEIDYGYHKNHGLVG